MMEPGWEDVFSIKIKRKHDPRTITRSWWVFSLHYIPWSVMSFGEKGFNVMLLLTVIVLVWVAVVA